MVYYLHIRRLHIHCVRYLSLPITIVAKNGRKTQVDDMTESRKKISVATGCYNEVGNIRELYDRIRAVFARHPELDWEIVIADNCSTDGTRDLLETIAKEDSRFKVILNAGNFGHIRSPFHAVLNTSGDAVVILVSDLQEPPELIDEFLKKWNEGYRVVCGVRSGAKESFCLAFARSLYYRLLDRCSGSTIIRDFTGFGLYDRCVIDAMRQFHEPYPYLRGLLSEVGFQRTSIPFHQNARKSGKTKNNWFTLYDMAMTGFVNHTKLPLRFAVFFGFLIAILSFLVAMVYFVQKLIFWDTFSFGMAPVMIGMFFIGAVQLIFIGIIGEYVGAIWTQVKNKPLVIEEKRINFDRDRTSGNHP